MKPRIHIINNIVQDYPDKHGKEIVEKAIKQCLYFFNPEKLNATFDVVFVETREEMDKIHGSPTEDWGVGGVYDDNTVYIFDEEVFHKVSCHPGENFFPTLVHEIAHIYLENTFKFNQPIWLNEGISYVVGGQDKTSRDIHIDITNAHTPEEWGREFPYGTSGRFTRYLIDNYGKDKIIKLIKNLVKNETKENFNKKFIEIYGKSFINILEEYYKKINFKPKKILES